MNEREMATTLGLLTEPVKNRVKVDPLLQAELFYLKYVFQTASNQKKDLGSVNPDMWCEFLPWHSLN